MTTTINAALDEARAGATADPIGRILDRVGERIGARATVRVLFGDPIERGDVSVVPVARVRWGYGGGGGTGPATTSAQNSETMAGGSGAGGAVMADPIGYLEIRPSGAAYVPLASPYPNPLLVIATGISIGLVIRALARLFRG